MDRRTFLRTVAGAAVATPLLPLGLQAADAAAPEPGVFRHGVASGDPAPDGIVLWTRVTEPTDRPVDVDWVVAEDEGLTRPVRSGRATATSDADHTVHVTVTGLAPATTYWYGFRTGGETSPVGRTRTAPEGAVERVRLGVCCCARFSDGYFNAYTGLAAAEVDLVVHLGDYIYEEVDDGPRGQGDDRPRLAVTLADYRSRYADARSDPDQQELHRRHPIAAIWDDHEFADNAWRDGAPEHHEADHGPWRERREAAARAWREWMPVRLPDPADPARIWRTIPYGDLVDLVLLDTRSGRDRQVTDDTIAALADPARGLLGAPQEAWLSGQVDRPGATWFLLANQVVLTPLRAKVPGVLPDNATDSADVLVVDGTALNADQWDGYPVAQQRLLGKLSARPGGGVVVLTGDIHCSMALENPGEATGPPVSEIVTPAVTTTTLGQRLGRLADQIFDALIADQDRVRWASIFEHGFVIVDVTAQRLAAEWWHVDHVNRRSHTWALANVFERDPQRGFVRTNRPSPGSAGLSRRADSDEDPWYDPVLSLPGGLGAAAILAGAAGLAVRRRSAGAVSGGDDDDS